MTQNQEAQASVREYFARLSLAGKTRSVIAQWQRLSVESFFVAMKLPGSFINRARQECGSAAQPLATLFSNIRWG